MAGDPNHFEHRVTGRLQDPHFKLEYEEAALAIEQTMAVLRSLNSRREELGMSKAELARKVGKRPEAVRRLLSAGGNPELNTVVAMTAALGGELRTVFPGAGSKRFGPPM